MSKLGTPKVNKAWGGTPNFPWSHTVTPLANKFHSQSPLEPKMPRTLMSSVLLLSPFKNLCDFYFQDKNIFSYSK